MQDALKQKILDHDRLVPRYTSYPTAPHFQPNFPEDEYRDWLSTPLAQRDRSLYIHIPFCTKLCYYCGCNTHITQNQERVTDYIDTLLAEAALVAGALPPGTSISHIHFGGGSPTILEPAAFSRMMGRLRKIFSIDEATRIELEADPRHMGEGRIATYAKNGVNRVSLGVQDFDHNVLQAVNRPQPFYLSLEAVNLCRAYDIECINFDLMYGLPGQTVETIRNTCETALLLKPNRIAFFGYAHVPWMKKHMGMLQEDSLPDSSQRYDLFMTGRQIFLDAGYAPVGIDHFVKPSDLMNQALINHTLRRNFQGYTTDNAPALIGLGASSIGAFPQGYAQNTADLKLYAQKIAEGRLPVSRGARGSRNDTIFAGVIEELMCYLRADLEAFENRFSLPAGFFDESLARLAPLAADGLVDIDGKIVSIAPDCEQIARIAAQAFDQYAAASGHSARHSRAI